MSYLDLKPGKVMIESGTGSGSFSHSIARTIAPTGHLYTFEYHQERVAVATKEFEEHGLEELVTIECRDVCKNGFGLVNKVDAGKTQVHTKKKTILRVILMLHLIAYLIPK